MPALIDLVGRRFGRLVVLSRAKSDSLKPVWRCECDCGCIVTNAHGADLRSGKHRSCGCLHRETITRHGHTDQHGYRTPTYSTWCGMVQRCTNPKAMHYARYGGRGIQVCTRWREFSAFLADMGVRPANMTLDRIDNDGDYEPSNCKWSTKAEQATNRHNNPQWKNRKRRGDGTFA